jgi:serine/threonine protein phosphatase PrpC
MMHYLLDAAGASDRGVKREHNEDAWSGPHPDLAPKQISAKGRLYLVADGVGGHQAGDVASKMAVEIVQQRYYADPAPDVATRLKSAIQTANQQIEQEASARPTRRGMGTTVITAVFLGGTLTVANVGDSRAYLIRDGHAQQISHDHTWVADQVRAGLLTRDEAAKHPQRNIITRSLGTRYELDIDIFERNIKPGDSVLLCSDGLSNVLADEEMGDLVNRTWTAEAAAKELVELTLKRGAPDNVTAVVITIVRPA